MIRNVILFRVRPDTTPEQLAEFERSMKAIRFQGCSRWELVRDLGLRQGNMTHAVIAEFDDVGAYRSYDAEAEHDRIRRDLLAPMVEQVERIQYEVSSSR